MRRSVLLLTLLAAFAALPGPALAGPIEDYEASWTHRTLDFQQHLGDTLPLRNAPTLGTHNSFNTRAETPTLSGLDANQVVSMGDQLRLDMRSLELDVHFVPSLAAGGAKAPVVCHGRSAEELHAGCTTERRFGERLPELVDWLDANPDETLLLYVEDHLEGDAGFDAAAAALDSALGPKLYKPPAGGGCTAMPLDLTRRAMRAAGKQVLVISSCGSAAWNGLVFDDEERSANESGSDPFGAYPACDPTRDRAFYAAHFIRFFEDSTVLSAAVGLPEGAPDPGLTPERVAAMIRCGVDLFGFDQLVAGDPRLDAAVWSWAPGQPKAGQGACVRQGPSGRWKVSSCRTRRAFACRTGSTWSVDTRRGSRRAFPRRCAGGRFAVPRTGLQAQELLDAMRAASVKTAWLRLKA